MAFPFSHRKTTLVLNFFARESDGEINKPKALKLVYFADRCHLRRFGRPITGDEHLAIPYGPVASGAKDLTEMGDFPRVEFAPDPDKTEAENTEPLNQYIREKEATFHMQWEHATVMDDVLLKNGFMLDYTLTRRPDFTKNEVFLAKDAHKESLLCLDQNLDPATMYDFKTHPELFFICLEVALDTTKKWNLKHHLGDKLKAF